MADAAIGSQRGQVEQLSGTGRTHQDKALKQVRIGHTQQFSNIALDIGCGVGAQPLPWAGDIPASIKKRRVTAHPHDLLQGLAGQSALSQFRKGQRQQLHKPDATCQRLRDPLDPSELLRPRDDKFAHA